MVDRTNRRPLKKRDADISVDRIRVARLGSCVALGIALAVAFVLHTSMAQARPAPAHAKEAFRTEILPTNWRFFVEVGRCEQPGKGRWGIHWTHPGPTYPGGLGVFAPLWTEDGIDGTDLAPTIPEATPVEQMIHAQRIIDKYGVYAWGCTGVALSKAPFYE